MIWSGNDDSFHVELVDAVRYVAVTIGFDGKPLIEDNIVDVWATDVCILLLFVELFTNAEEDASEIWNVDKVWNSEVDWATSERHTYIPIFIYKIWYQTKDTASNKNTHYVEDIS